MFAPVYKRNWLDKSEQKTEIVVHPLFKAFLEEGRDTSHFQGSHELSLRDHFEMQRVCQAHIDNACSKTLNINSKITADELSNLYMEYLPELKGVTIYPDNSRPNQPLTPIPRDQIHKYTKQFTDTEATTNTTCKEGACDL